MKAYYCRFALLGACTYYSKQLKHVFNKVYALNKQLPKYVVIACFSYKINILSLALTDYKFVSPYIHFMHLALLGNSVPDYL